jgi:serine/threonine-protein kinase
VPRRFRIVEHLGAGAFGEVLRAVTDDVPAREVAVKLLAPGIEGEDVARRLRDEGRMLRLLSHPAIVRVERLARFPGGWGVVLEYVPGVDLSGVVAAGGMPAGPALTVLADVADALDAAWHAADPGTGEALHVVHRDIKPANVRLTPEGAVRVIDFGAARAEFAAREAQTRSATFGSWDYMAPERFEGADSPAGDVFALALVATELLTGLQSRETPKLERRFREWFDERMAHVPVEATDAVDLLVRMVSFDAGQRPSAAEVRDRARRLATGVAGPSLAEWAQQHVPGLATAPEPVDAPSRIGEVLEETIETVASRPRRRWMRPVLALVSVTGIAAFLLIGARAPALARPAGRVLKLDGRSGHVLVPGTSSLDLGGSATFEGWARVEGWYRDDIFPMFDRIWRLEIARRFATFNTGEGSPSLYPVTLAQHRWYHVAAVHDHAAETVSWYLDGEPVMTEHFDQPWFDFATQPTDLVIGAGPFGAPEFAIGFLDEVRVWSRPLPPEEIGRPLAGRTGLVGAWNFDEEAGPVRDLSGNGHDGTLQGEALRVPADTAR